MPKKVKKFLFPTVTLVASFYLSILFGIGVIIGYLVTKVFHDKFVETGKIKLIFLNFGRWKIHLHHWLIGVLIIIAIGFGGWLSVLPKIFLGSICGIALHDLHFDREWYRVILRRY